MDLELVAEGLRFPEGPVWRPDGELWLVEVAGGRISSITADGSVTTVAETGGGPNGLATGPDGGMLFCDNGGFATHSVDGLELPEPFPPQSYRGGALSSLSGTGSVVPLYTSSGGHPLSAPNDLVLDGTGGVWFTDLGKERARSLDIGSVHYGRADGSGVREVLTPLISPNGIALSPEGDRLYVAETIPGRIWWWPVTAPGILDTSGPGPAGGRLLHGFGGYQLPDSMAVDSEGNVCVGTLISGVVSVIDSRGTLVEQISMPVHDPLVTNICFGGPDGRTAYVTSSGRGRVYRTRWPHPGAPLAHAS